MIKSAFETHAAHAARLAALPKEPAGYEFGVPKDFKVPDGWALDDKHPLVEPFRAYALKAGLDQDQFKGGVQMFGEYIVEQIKKQNEIDAAETKKMGANGTARVTALKTWASGIVGAEAAARFLGDEKNPGLVAYAADALEILEKLQIAFSSGGGGSFNGNGRDSDPPKVAVPVAARWYPDQQKAS